MCECVCVCCVYVCPPPPPTPFHHPSGGPASCRYEGKTAEEWAVEKGHDDLADMLHAAWEARL